MQDAGESYDHYRTALRQLADRCEFETITADQILRDKLVFGIQDSKVQERLRKDFCMYALYCFQDNRNSQRY